jgi:DNA repair protein RadD
MSDGIEARPYQSLAVIECLRKWMTEGRRGVLVSPTGSGKTFMAELAMVALRDKRQVFFAHTQEIILQTAKRLRNRFPHVGVVMADEPLTPEAPIQVATVQTCLKRGYFPPADAVYLDECHHYASDDWAKLQDQYAAALVLGLTATPQRGDGRALSAHFDWLVVAAKYSELVEAGHIVPCRAYQPPEIMVKGLAHDPLKAWQRYAPGQRTFLFANSVKNAEKFAKQFRDAGVPSAMVEAGTPKPERRHIMSLFGKGDITVLTSVNALTEGVDIPEASCAIFAKSFSKMGQYMQAGGRVLRPAKGKTEAIIIDLTGATLIHGLPTEDREYSLDGEGIKRTSEAPLRNCLSCGATVLSAYPVCPECGYQFPKAHVQEIKIYSFELRAVFAGQATASVHKANEFKRLLAWSKERGWSVSWAIKEYRTLFSEAPDMSLVDERRRYEEWVQLQKVGHVRGFKRGFTFARYKSMFGENPPKQWKMMNPKDLASA